MKVAVLIMAHDQPTHLAKVVDFLTCNWMHIFIHVDRKVDIAEFRQCIPKHKRVIFLDDYHRIWVNWGGFSQVKATLHLLDASLNFGEHFDRFCLLSGSDFPIKTLNDIKAGFDSEKEFIRIVQRLDVSDDNTHCKNVKYLHFMDSLFSEATGKIPRKVYDKISLYHGSAYWALTEGCVRYITEFLHRNRDYITFHENTLCPDEIFFHSIVKSSPFAANITHDFEKANYLEGYFALNEHGCHYIDWNAKGVSLPKILNENDLNTLLNSEALFARKFRESNSGNLPQMIQQAIGT